MSSPDDSVLVLSRDAEQRAVLARLVGEIAPGVRVTDEVDEGLALARLHVPRVIVCDDDPLRGLRAVAVLGTVRNDPVLRSCQVLLLTTADEAGRQDLRNHGADDCVGKPVNREEFGACLRARLRRAEAVRLDETRAVGWLRDTVVRRLSHELNTPLTGILGFAELLERDLDQFSSEAVRSMVTDIQRSALRLHRTLANYLSILDRPASFSGGGYDRTSAALASDTIAEAARETAAQNDRLEDLVLECRPVELPVDPQVLRTLAVELTDNACKFSPRGSRIVVRLATDRGQAFLQVHDRGRGMTAEQIAQIGPFRQFDRAKYEQQGLGVGLALVQQMAQCHGAILRITSDPGLSVFTVAWPVDNRDAQLAEAV